MSLILNSIPVFARNAKKVEIPFVLTFKVIVMISQILIIFKNESLLLNALHFILSLK